MEWLPAKVPLDRPGITNAVLGRARATDGLSPYDWLVDALADARSPILDVACEDGPLGARLGPGWVGVDRSPPELHLAASTVPGRHLVLGDASALPARTAGVGGVVCSMALMLFDDPAAVVAEIARVLRPGAGLVALLPASSPLSFRDRARYGRMLAALRLRRLPFPWQQVIHDPEDLVARGGLSIVSSERQRFAYPVASGDDGALLVRSLYAPGVAPERLEAAERLARRWVGSAIGIPLHRLVAVRG